MGKRTIELTIVDGFDDAEEARAGRLVLRSWFESQGSSSWIVPPEPEQDRDLDFYLFDARDLIGQGYVVVIHDSRAKEIWERLWSNGECHIVIDRGMAMRRIPRLPPESDEKPIALEIEL